MQFVQPIKCLRVIALCASAAALPVMAGSAIAQPVSQKWDGSVPNWQIRVPLIGDQIRGELPVTG
jgi:hypothetical protein